VKERPRAIAVLISVFLLGCILGSAGSYFYFKKYSKLPMMAREGGPPPPHGQRRWPELLQMTPEQDARFNEIMRESRQRLDALSIEQGQKIRSVLAETNQKISSILDDKQRKKFEELLKEIESWRSRERRDRRFGPPPGPDRKISGDPKEKSPREPAAVTKEMKDWEGRPPHVHGQDSFR
jgi:Spy/CpxP family protein refolding chaperone